MYDVYRKQKEKLYSFSVSYALLIEWCTVKISDNYVQTGTINNATECDKYCYMWGFQAINWELLSFILLRLWDSLIKIGLVFLYNQMHEIYRYKYHPTVR